MLDEYLIEQGNFVPTLYTSSSRYDYYQWEDTMEKFLSGRGLRSHIVIEFAKLTFSERLFRCWTEMQQRQIYRCEDTCMTWKDMKVVLRRIFDAQFKPEKKKVVSDVNIDVSAKNLEKESASVTVQSSSHHVVLDKRSVSDMSMKKDATNCDSDLLASNDAQDDTTATSTEKTLLTTGLHTEEAPTFEEALIIS